MSQPVALVTGASSGIGQATAQLLAAKGFYVFAARRLDQLEKMRSANLEPFQLDVTQPASVKAAVKTIHERTRGRLDVLVNNAGYALYGILEEVDLKAAQAEFEVNIFGLVRLTQAVLPLIRANRVGRIINLSSVAGKLATPVAGWYSASKYAVEALSEALRLEVAGFGIEVVLIEPGAIRTEFESVAFDQLSHSADLDAYRPLKNAFSRLLKNSYKNAPGPERIAQAILRAVTAKRPRVRYALPIDSSGVILLRRLLSDRLLDRIVLGQLKA